MKADVNFVFRRDGQERNYRMDGESIDEILNSLRLARSDNCQLTFEDVCVDGSRQYVVLRMDEVVVMEVKPSSD